MVDIGLHFVARKSDELIVVMPAGGINIIYGSGRNFWERVGFVLGKVYEAGQRYKSESPEIDVWDDAVMIELPKEGGSISLNEGHLDDEDPGKKWEPIKKALNTVFDESKKQPIG